MALPAAGPDYQPSNLTHRFDVDWTVEQLRTPAQRTADRNEEPMSDDASTEYATLRASRDKSGPHPRT